MNVTAGDTGIGRPGGASWLWRRQLETYPSNRPRLLYLAITVLATVMLYYELYVVGSVSTLVLANLHMSFTFFVVLLAVGNLIGAFGSLFAGLTDRLGRANLVVGGLLVTGVLTAFVIPAATNRWAFGFEGFAVGLVEGICLVATPALIRDFSPQVGRATAMGFWTAGPVAGSLIVAVVGSATIPAVVTDPRIWTHQYVICGIAGLVVWLIALVGLRELSPRLRDQLMVTLRDRALIEARAKGIDVAAALRHPFRQLLKARHRRVRVRRVGHAAHLLHGRRILPHLPDHGVRFLSQERQRPGQLELGLQRRRGAAHRGHLRPVPGAQAVHGDRRRHRRGDDGGLPGTGRPSPGLLHARGHAGGAVARPGCRLHPLDGQLHRNGGSP